VAPSSPPPDTVSGSWCSRQARTAVCRPVTGSGAHRRRAYRLQLPEGARIHDVFHVGVLKPFHGEPPSSTLALPPLHHSQLLEVPECVLKVQLCRGIRQALVKWAGLPAVESTWEPLDEFKAAFPAFQLEDELIVDGGGDVMVGIQYG
jgi:hypothetical protein